MTDFYQDMQEIATDLLTEFNQGTIKIIRDTFPNAKPYDPGEPVPTEYSFKGVTRGVSKKFVDGTFILESDLQATLAYSSEIVINPKTDRIKVDNIEYQILSVKNTPASGTIVSIIIIYR